MIPEQIKNLKEWIDALRSGDYKQTRKYLIMLMENTHKDVYCYCCLGVASVLDETVEIKDYDISETRLALKYTGSFLDSVTPPTMWFTLRFGLPPGMISELIVMNDEEEKTFIEIADYLETHLPKENQ